MNGEGCWSTVVCRPAERVALGLSSESEWLLQCRLGIGHGGNHATDASVRPRHDRRLWLEWNDFDNRAQSLIERNPCPVPSPEGAGCVFFAGHGGPHFYARTNGHVPSAMSAGQGGHHVGGYSTPGPQTGGYPVTGPHSDGPQMGGSQMTGPQLGGPQMGGQPPVPQTGGYPVAGPPTGAHGTPGPGYPPPGGPVPAPPSTRTGAHHFPEPPRPVGQLSLIHI